MSDYTMEEKTRRTYEAMGMMAVAAGELRALGRIDATNNQIKGEVLSLACVHNMLFGDEVPFQEDAYLESAYKLALDRLPDRLKGVCEHTSYIDDKVVRVWQGWYEVANIYGKVEQAGYCSKGLSPDEVYRLIQSEQAVVVISANDELPPSCSECLEVVTCPLPKMPNCVSIKVGCTKKRHENCPLRAVPTSFVREDE